MVSVTDTGKGIDSDITTRLFTKFSTKSETGTGLGLFICKSIIEAHGGKIWAKNNIDGKGSTFSLTIAYGIIDATKACLTIDEERRQQVYIIHYPYFLIIPEILL